MQTLDQSKKFQGLLHRFKNRTILELELDTYPAESIELNTLRRINAVYLFQLLNCNNRDRLLQVLAEQIFELSGFNRVLVYGFDADWNGTVLAEKSDGTLPTFLYHSFPASDIPSQARALFEKNKMRILVDVDAPVSRLSDSLLDKDSTQLDLSYSALRAMSPIHVEYLKNMGVSASMSMSLVVNGRLWGLIACHHKSSRQLAFSFRSACDLLATVAAGLIAKFEDSAIQVSRHKLLQELDKVLLTLSGSDDLASTLMQNVDLLNNVTNASGVALIGIDRCATFGRTPQAEQIEELFQWLMEKDERVYCTDKLTLEQPHFSAMASEASGLLAIDVSLLRPLWILWFRPEKVHEISWAGRPEKLNEIHGHEVTLHPRKSFEKWTELVKGQAKPWENCEVEFARALQKQVFELMLAEIVRAEKAAENLRQRREDLLDILAHDINSSVMSVDRVLSYLFQDKSQSMDAELLDELQILERANRSQLKRVEKLIQVLTYEVGQARLFAQPIVFSELFKEVLAEVNYLSPDLSVQVTMSIKQNCVEFLADRKSLKCILLNLLQNAKQAAGPDGIVELICDCSRQACELKVRNSGAFISQLDQSTIFEKFWQGGEFQAYSARVGMGLYLCKKIVETLHGTISCESSPLGGTTFSVVIPASN